MSLQEITKLVNKVQKALYDNEKFATGVLAVQARRVAEAFPTDQTAIGMTNFLSKRASAEPLISRAELKDVYNKLYTPNNQLAKVFANELGLSETKRTEQSALWRRDAKEGVDFTSEYEKIGDPVLNNALASVFDENAPYKPYSGAMAKKAEKACVHELNCTGVFPKKIAVVAGQPDILICQATYETPKGVSNLLVPVEIKNEKALMPSMFLSTAGFLDISKENVTEHIHATAGKAYRVDVQKLLKTVSGVKNKKVAEPIGEVEQLMMKVNASRETPAHWNTNAVLYQEVDAAEPNVKVAEYEQPEEVVEFAKHLTSAVGIAEMQFGKDAVEKGRKSLLFEMGSFGHGNAQAVVADLNEDTVFYSVAVGRDNGFRVPVKFKDGSPLIPQVIIADGQIFEFSKAGVSKLLSGKINAKVLAETSTLFAMPAHDVVEFVREAINQNALERAEEGILVLKESGNDVAHKLALSMFTEALSGRKEETQSKCSMPVKNAASKHVLCGHTNLPLHKVYQDAHGDCQPLYRRKMAASYEGATFIHNKICWD